MFKIKQKVIAIYNFNSAIITHFKAYPIKKEDILTISEISKDRDGKLCFKFEEVSCGTNTAGYDAKGFKPLTYCNISKEIASQFIETEERSDVKIKQPILN